jgi:hypothetical protein
MQKVVHFLTYNNAVPIVLGSLFLGASATFAMVNPEVVYTEESQVLSIDNTYIAEKSLDSYTPQVRIFNVTEDEEYYYVEYKLSTIMLEESVWQDVEQAKTLKVSKLDLGEYRDLGLYVSAQLKQLIDREVAYLKEVQEFEKSNITKKTVATKYGGLVGALLDDSMEELPGYTPVVEESKERVKVNALLAASVENAQEDAGGQPGVVAEGNTESSSSLGFQLLGNNPARIPKGAQYSDLGVIVLENRKIVDYTVQVFLNGKEVQYVDIDTTEDAQYTVVYKTKNAEGESAQATRTIIVGEGGEPYVAEEEIEESLEEPLIEEEPEEETEETEEVTEEETATTTEETIETEEAPEETATTTDETVTQEEEAVVEEEAPEEIQVEETPAEEEVQGEPVTEEEVVEEESEPTTEEVATSTPSTEEE